MIKRIISAFLIMVLFSSTIFTSVVLSDEQLVKVSLFSEDFESYEIGDKPYMTIYDSAGRIFVDAIETLKVLNIKNVNGISNTTVEKEIARVEGKKVIASVKFMQLQTGSSKNTVLALHDGNASLSILANKGKFYLDATEICSYVANKWYEIIVSVDLNAATAEITVDGNTKTIDVSIKGIDKISSSAMQSPGFYIDNIKIETEQLASEIFIDGISVAAIPRSDKSTYTYTAQLKDDTGNKIPLSDVAWTYTFKDNNENITTNEKAVVTVNDKNELILNVNPGAENGKLIIEASVLNGSFVATKTVTIEQVSASELKIVGDSRIAGFSDETYTYQYSVAIKDQNNEDVFDYGEFIWTMEGVDGYEIPDYISLDADTGIITVTSDTPYREFIRLKATSKEDAGVWQEKKILVTDGHSYVLDNYRYNAVKTHIDNAMVYAQDPYDDSPLLSNLINVNAKQPGAYIMDNGETMISHNVSPQSSLMRSMFNLSNFEDDEKYRDRVYDIYEYNMELSKEHPTYMYEGGHHQVDLKTKQGHMPANYNETKSAYIYRTPVFDLDYDRGALWSKATFVGHARFDNEPNWRQLAISRHWDVKNHPLTEESVEQWWNDTNSFDRTRKGSSTNTDGACFPSAYTEMMVLFAQYYEAAKAKGDQEAMEQIHEWADLVYTSLDQTGYNPLTLVDDIEGNEEYNGLWNLQGNSEYREDWSNIYEVWGTKGRHWYDKDNSGGNGDVDRWFMNYIISDRDLRPISEGGEGFGKSSDGKSWVDMYYNKDPYKGVNEQNWMCFLETYAMARECSLINGIGGMCDFVEVLEEDDELRIKLIEKMTNAAYNYLNLRYDYKDSNFRAKMSWGLDITGWKVPHTGYYSTEGSYISAKNPETSILKSLAILLKYSLNAYENAGEDEEAIYTNINPNKYPNKNRKEQLKEQSEAIWEILRHLSKNNFEIGDIGDPFKGIEPDLNFATTATSKDFVEGFVYLYQTFEKDEYLKMAQIIANNIITSSYDEGVGLFTNNGALLATTASTYTYPLLLLESVLLDDYTNLMTARTYSGQALFEDFKYTEDANGFTKNGTVSTVYAQISEPSVKQSAILIEEPFTMQVGESREIEYKVLPYDADTGVLWDVSDPEIADISSSGTIKAKRAGTVEVRCVSSSVRGLSSETITVTIE